MKYHYIYDKSAEPLFKIKSGETVTLETEDAFSGLIKENGPVSEETTNEVFRLMAPVTGPVVVEEAEPGDWLAIKIDHIECLGYGVSPIGLLYSAIGDKFGEKTRAKVAKIENNVIYFNDKIKFDAKPMIGTLGTTIHNEVPRARYQGIYGGNVDCPTFSIGNTVLLPVFVKGAYVYAGDVHAIQGDGEMINPFESPARITMTMNVIKNKSSVGKWPRVLTDTTIETVTVGRDFTDAARIAMVQMIEWLTEDYGFEFDEAAYLCGQVVDARPCQIVNYLHSARCVLNNKYLELNK